MTAPHELPAPYAGPPLRIAYVGNFRHSWCTERHVAASLESLGHTILCRQEDELDWSTVPVTVRRLGVQALFWTRTWPAEVTVVEPVLKELAAEGIPTVSFHLDRWFGLDRAHQVDDQPFFRTSLVVSPDDSPHWAEHGVNHFWLPPGVYGPECEPVPPNPRRWPWDVVFVGSHPYPHPEWQKYRTDLLSAFRAAFGRRFAILPRERRGTPIRGRDLQELYATVPVVLGDSCLAGESHRYWSDRVPETLGRGGLLIHPYVKGLDDWYLSGHELLEYEQGNFAEAVQMARAALDDPNESGQVAERGRRVVLARDTYAHRMGTVLAVAEGIYGGYRDVSLPVSQPTRTGVTIPASCGACGGIGGEHPRACPLAPPEAAPSLRVKLNRWSAVFEPRPGTTDAEVIGEVWTANDYRVPPEGFRRAIVVDIGANCGFFSVLAAKAGASVVYAYEPEPENRARLEHHIKLNRVERQVKVLPLAVTDGLSPTVDMIGTGGGARTTEGGSVVTTTLSEVIAMHGPISYMKVDAEGSEGPMFAAVSAEDLAGVDRIGLEWHGPDGPPGHPGAPHLAHLTGEEFGPLVTKLADAGEVLTFGHPRRGGLIHWKRYGA